MLLRSISAPILDSWLPQQHCSRESSPEPESSHVQLQRRNRSLSILSSKSIDEHTGELLHQALSEHKELSVLKQSNNDNNNLRSRRSSLDESSHGTAYRRKILDPSSSFLVERLFSSCGLGENKVRDDDDDNNDDDLVETLVSGGGMGNSGGKICNGGGVGGNGVNGGGSEDATDVYYREMIESNPNNSLLTGNYAKFLKEVRGDMKKAEEYCERAILGKTNDGNVLSLYADLILQNHGDRERAHSYFQQAAKMSPEDCYVQASYARFLWDVAEEEEDREEEEEQSIDVTHLMPPATVLSGFHQHTPVTTRS